METLAFVLLVATAIVDHVSSQQLQEIFATCVMPGNPVGPATGTIRFHQDPNTETVTITGSIRGLTPGLHGFHVHEFGNVADCLAAGGHYNPGRVDHGSPKSFRHVGDLGNIMAGQNGVATLKINDQVIRLQGSQSIVGRGLVVHANEDDLGQGGDAGSRSTGNSGARVGCCVIGLSARPRR